MGIVLRQSAKSTVILAIGVLLGALLNYFYTFAFEKSELGFITNIVNQAALSFALLLMGSASVIVAYLPRYIDDTEKRKVLFTICLIFPIVPIVIFTVSYSFLKSYIVSLYNINDQAYIEKYYYWLPVIIFGWMYMTLFEHYLVSQKRAAKSTFVREVVHRACMVLLTIAYFMKIIDFSNFIALMSLAYLVPFILAVIFCIRIGGVKLSFNFKVFSKKEYAQIFHFSWYHMLEGAAFILLGYIDSLMLAPLASDGMASLSVYRNALFATTMIIIPLRAINASSYAVLNESYISNDFPKLQNLYGRINLNSSIIGVLLASLVLINADNLVRIFPPGYEEIKSVALILIIGKLFQVFSGISSEVIGFSSYYKFNFRASTILLLLIIGLNRLLIPTYGIEGAAWGATISLAIFSVAKTIFLKLKLNLPATSHLSWRVLLIGIITTIIVYFIPFLFDVIIDVFIRSSVLVVIYGTAIWRLCPESDIAVFVHRIIKTKRLF